MTTEERVTSRREIDRVLADARFGVPEAPAGERGLAWLRSTVSRFVNGPAHEQRRALVEAEIGRLDPAALRRAARERADAVLDAAGGRVEAMSAIARPAPLAALGAGLGIPASELDGAVADTMVVAPAYGSGASDERIDAAVERLRVLVDRGGPEATAAAIAILAQACEATAGLIGGAIVLAGERSDVDAVLRETLVRAAPVRLMRRVSPDGAPVTLDLDAASRDSAPDDPPLTFGSGVRPCPGDAQAVALAAGVLDAVLPRCAIDPASVTWADLPALRLPDRIELAIT